MKFSSYVLISLFSIVLGTVIISPQLSIHTVVPKVNPQVTLEISHSSSALAATTSVPVAEIIPAAPSKIAAAHRIVTQPVSARPVVIARNPYPVQLAIPAIGLNSPVTPVGTNAKGEMDVPSGSTNTVGWYKDGVIPGAVGSAVMDAHVFAGFSLLHSIRVGDDVYVQTGKSEHLHFVVTAVHTYALGELTSDMLFENTNDRHLNLITCAGTLTPDHTTYDHRLIVYTELVP